MKLIKEYINSDETPPKKKGKVTARILTLYCDVFHIEPAKDIKHILAQYRVRQTRKGEIKRKNDYIADFDYKSSLGYKLIESMIDTSKESKAPNANTVKSKAPNANVVKSLIQLIIAEEKKNGREMKINREALRSKAGLYKFITENYEIIEKYKQKGTHISFD